MQRSTKIAGMTALFKALISGDFLCVECLMFGLFCFESSSIFALMLHASAPGKGAIGMNNGLNFRKKIFQIGKYPSYLTAIILPEPRKEGR